MIKEIKKEKLKWNQNLGGKYYRQYGGEDKGKIISKLFQKYYKEIFTDKKGFSVTALLKRMGIKLKLGNLNPDDPNKNAWGLFDEKANTIWVSSHLKKQYVRETIVWVIGGLIISEPKHWPIVYFRDALRSYEEVIINDFVIYTLVHTNSEELEHKLKNKTVYEIANEYLVSLRIVYKLLKRAIHRKGPQWEG